MYINKGLTTTNTQNTLPTCNNVIIHSQLWCFIIIIIIIIIIWKTKEKKEPKSIV